MEDEIADRLRLDREKMNTERVLKVAMGGFKNGMCKMRKQLWCDMVVNDGSYRGIAKADETVIAFDQRFSV